MSAEPIFLWYNESTDQLALGGDGWDFLVSIAFVPFVTPCPHAWPADAADPRPFSRAEHEIAIEKTREWVNVGEF